MCTYMTADYATDSRGREAGREHQMKFSLPNEWPNCCNNKIWILGSINQEQNRKRLPELCQWVFERRSWHRPSLSLKSSIPLHWLVPRPSHQVPLPSYLLPDCWRDCSPSELPGTKNNSNINNHVIKWNKRNRISLSFEVKFPQFVRCHLNNLHNRFLQQPNTLVSVSKLIYVHIHASNMWRVKHGLPSQPSCYVGVHLLHTVYCMRSNACKI